MDHSSQKFDIERQAPRPQIYITSSQEAELTGILGQVVQWLGLDSYGSRLLNKNAAVSMKAIALLLIANFVFDLGAWWLLFNAVFSGGQGVFDLGVHSVVAMFFSLLVSTVILIYERQFMTADISGQWNRLTLPVGLRIAVIIMAAAITTQPVELMFFKGPIERRIHEESIRLEALTRLKDWQDAQKKQSLEGIPDFYRVELQKAEWTQLQEEKKLKDLRSSLRVAESRLSRAQYLLSRAGARLRKAEGKNKDYWNRQVAHGQEAVSNVNGEVESIKQQISDQEVIVNDSLKDMEKAAGEVKGQVDNAVKESQRVRNWFAHVRQSKRGQVVVEPGSGGWIFQDQTYDFFEQLRVLSDLSAGRHARWPEASQEDLETLAGTFNFKTPADEMAQALLDAKFYSYAYWAVFGIAFVIPMLVLAFKLLQPQELRDYYSRERQDRALYELRARSELSERGFATAQRFLEKAGATVRHRGERGMEIVSGSLGRLTSFFQLPILLTVDSLKDEDVAELAQSLHPSLDDQRWMAGILFYHQPPDALALNQMAGVQLNHRFITIPISLAAAERALSTNIDCRSQLAEFAEPYLPGANLFDDRNAISDTTTFFGRMKLLRRLEEDLLKHQGIGLFGLRKSGKTSILLQLTLILRYHPVVYLDLQLYGGKSRYGAELFNEIVQRLSTMLDVRAPGSAPRFEPFARDVAAADVASEFARRIRMLDVRLQASGYKPPIVCLLDEVERILPFPEDSREKVEEFNAFFGALRALCQQQRQLSLLVADVHPDCNRINQWTQAGVPTNPVFKFFKEIFLKPFPAEDTNTMLINIGRLMGCKQAFDARTLEQIFQASGGHPFVARQLASLLYQKVSFKDHETISWTAAQRYLDKSLTYSSTLKDYIATGIWGDLQKRRFRSAMGVLQALACRKDDNKEMAETSLRAQIGDQFTENQLLDALQWLDAVGLIEWEETADFDHPRIHLPLLSYWLRMNLSIEEVRQWQIA